MAKVGRPRKPSVFHSYKGGYVIKHPSGYLMEYCPSSPMADKRGMVRQHRLVMAELIGRPLVDGEIVHHKNRDTMDNRPENLALMFRSEHQQLHYAEDGSRTALPLTEDQVRKALKGRTTKQAARILGCHPMTLYNRFDHLLKKRKTPCRADDPKVIAAVRKAAADPKMAKRRFEAETGISLNLIKRVCLNLGVEWVTSERIDRPRKPANRKR